VAGVVLDPGAGADLEQHLDIERGARFQPLGLEQLARRLQLRQPPGQLAADGRHRALDLGTLGYEVLGGIDGALLELGDGVAGQRIDLADPLDLVAPELDPDGLLGVGREDLDRVAADAERALLEADVVAAVLNPDQLTENVVPAPLLPPGDGDHELPVLDRVAQAVNGAHRGDDDHVIPLHQAGGGAEAETLDVLVDRGVLLDIDVGRRDVRLGLVVVVVRDEVLDRVAGQELPQLPVELGRQGLVVGQDQGGLAVVGDGVRQGHRLTRPRDAEQRLVLLAPAEAGGQLGDGLGLVPGGGERGNDLKAVHGGNIRVPVFVR
jgi:hypothetical protein